MEAPRTVQISRRPPAVAGLFYPGETQALAETVKSLLAAVSPVTGGNPRGMKCPVAGTPTVAEAQPTAAPIKALIVPHAGYIFSGPIAASAYALLAAQAATIHRVVLLGPCHRVAIRGLAVPQSSAFVTPLGEVPLDQAGIASALQLPQVMAHDAAHAQEHALEVQLPFLQRVLGPFQLVPLAVGQASATEVAEVLEKLWGGPETLIVISSDLSHYHAYTDAQRRDRASVDSILHLQALTDHAQACGATPINGLLACALPHGLQPHLLDLRNSGDTAGDKDRVVGYASFAFREHENA